MLLECSVTVSASFPLFGDSGAYFKTFAIHRVPDHGVLWIAADLRLSGAHSVTLNGDDGSVMTWRKEQEQ